MAKMIRCRDVGVDCDFEARGATMDELLEQCAIHAKAAHNMKEISKELRDKIRASARDVS